jgi:pimeloyl-ACP methyl ester carboxylesterase
MYGIARAKSAITRGAAGIIRNAAASAAAVCASLALVLAGCAAYADPAGPVASGPQCRPERIPVRLPAGNPVTYPIAGWLCADGSPAGRTLEVLVPGLTYGASYWDFPLDPARYSYVRAATAAGYATLAIDRLGTGASGRPPAAEVTATSEALALHQVVTALRAGQIGPGAFRRIVLVGHSFGSDIALREAAAYADVSGLVITGWLTAGNPAGHRRVRSSYATGIAREARSGALSLPAGYVTTRPGTRGGDFYNTAYASGAVIAEDESLKQPVTSGELATVAVPVPRVMTRRIHVPVLLAAGQDDAINCDPARPGLSCASAAAVLARESANYSPQACLQAYVLPRAGHSMNLHPDAPEWFAAATRWAATYVSTAPPPSRKTA